MLLKSFLNAFFGGASGHAFLVVVRRSRKVSSFSAFLLPLCPFSEDVEREVSVQVFKSGVFSAEESLFDNFALFFSLGAVFLTLESEELFL